MDLSYFSRSMSGEARAREHLNALFDIERRMVTSFDDPKLNLPLLNVVATSPLAPIDDTTMANAFEALKKANNNWPTDDAMWVRTLHTDHVGLLTESNMQLVSGFIREFLDHHV